LSRIGSCVQPDWRQPPSRRCVAGDFDALVAVLDADVVIRPDSAAMPPGASALRLSRGTRFARPALVDGSVGVVVGPNGRLFRVLGITVADGKIVAIDVVADPARLRDLDLAILGDSGFA
jgi:hypothetical protein